jgi:hypothetical protein
MGFFDRQHDSLKNVILSSGKTTNVGPFYFGYAHTFLAKQLPLLFKGSERGDKVILAWLFILLKKRLYKLLYLERCLALKVLSDAFEVQLVTFHESFQQYFPIFLFWQVNPGTVFYSALAELAQILRL